MPFGNGKCERVTFYLFFFSSSSFPAEIACRRLCRSMLKGVVRDIFRTNRARLRFELTVLLPHFLVGALLNRESNEKSDGGERRRWLCVNETHNLLG